MWTFEELQTQRRLTPADILPAIKALIPEPDLACLADDGELDHGLALHLLHETIYDWPAPNTPAWVQAAIAANPGPAADFKAGKAAALNRIKGHVMKLSKGKANPALVGEILERKLRS